MKTTGKCEEEFKEYLREQKFGIVVGATLKGHSAIINLSAVFNKLPETMKYGVYVDYFDSVGIWIDSYMFSIENNIAIEFIAEVETEDAIWNTLSKTRAEVRKKSIEKANEIRNEQLKN